MLFALQGLSEKFSSVGQEVVHIQRALESTVVTSDSSLTDALNAVIAFIKTIFPWSKFVAIYRVRTAPASAGWVGKCNVVPCVCYLAAHSPIKPPSCPSPGRQHQRQDVGDGAQ